MAESVKNEKRFGKIIVDELVVSESASIPEGGRIETVSIPLNAATALTTDNKAYFRIPSTLKGATLTSVAAMCKDGSSSGAVTLTVKNGATSMLSTNLTIDEGETDSSTAATPAVIDTDHDNVATADQIEIAVSGAGTGVTYCAVELQFTKA